MATLRVEFTDVVLESMGRNLKACKAKLHAKVTPKVSVALGWGEIPEFLGGGSVETDLHASKIELTPRDGELTKYGVELKARRISNFTFTKVQAEGKGKTKKQPHDQMHFEIEFSDDKALASLEKFQVNCGHVKSILRINYEPQPKQGTLVDVTNNTDQASLLPVS